jgi:BirA family biotin operon repressor/biotin-[acetyl-CoA-carboxylase] ligase
MLDKKKLQRGLTTRAFGKKLFVFESIDSTNICAKTLAEVGCGEGAVVLADFQTHGRGRLGRSWLSEPGANLLFSLVLHPPQAQITLLPFLMSVGIARIVEHIIKQPVGCKWPNDVLLNNKKLCGILIENSLTTGSLAYSIVGIGLNVNQRSFPNSLHSVTSLAVETGKEFDRASLFKSILQELEDLYDAVKKGRTIPILEEWNRRCTMLGHAVTIRTHDTTYEGIAERLSEDGVLVLHTASGAKTFYAGDATVISS